MTEQPRLFASHRKCMRRSEAKKSCDEQMAGSLASLASIYHAIMETRTPKYCQNAEARAPMFCQVAEIMHTISTTDAYFDAYILRTFYLSIRECSLYECALCHAGGLSVAAKENVKPSINLSIEIACKSWSTLPTLFCVCVRCGVVRVRAETSLLQSYWANLSYLTARQSATGGNGLS